MSSSKVWLVTGSSAGLGRAVVEHALMQGSKVVATCRNPDDLSALTDKYSSAQLIVLPLNVTVPEEIISAFARAVEAFGRVDVVYNNAGSGVMAEVEGTPDETARKHFEVNFWGSANVSREAVRVFREVNSPPGGRLLQASSLGAIKANPGLGYYNASKSALEGLSESLSREVHPSWNIKITILQLGLFATRAFTPAAMTFMSPHPAYNQPDNAVKLAREWSPPGGAMHAFLADPVKAAREIYKISEDDSVGLRVVLGQDAIGNWQEKLKDIEEFLKKSEGYSADLKFDA
ncbi:hypothetical protein D9619_000102 [Psilocybe cf. subviscida]|uniref:NAD(P)-binding protein n=1 Tax=Psilocybe cf. subviscida TaxID=2480587 RepID=A0A8H5F243_9AGAR|nr:hypothetical protein D9619_000102 [Psilocybe cf. subviscida]